MEQATQFIGTSNVGDRVVLHCFMNKEQRMSKKNEAYWSLNLGDTTGELFANIWGESQLFPFFEKVENGQYLRVTGVIGEYNGVKNMQIQTVKELEAPESFIVNEAAIKKDIGLRIRNIQDPGLQALLFRVFKDKEFANAYFRAPLQHMPTAAGCWRGGAAAFASKLCQLIDYAADGLSGWTYQLDEFTTQLNKEFLMTLAILEPIGRVRAYQVIGHRVSKTDEGELFSEQYLTNEMLWESIQAVDLPDEKKQLLKHAIASVPGKEYAGSLIYDRTREAVAFNMLWNLNMQMMHFEQLDRMQQGQGGFVKLYKKTVSLDQFKPYAPLTDEEVEELAEATRDHVEEAPEAMNEQEEMGVSDSQLAEPTTSMQEALANGQPAQ